MLPAPPLGAERTERLAVPLLLDAGYTDCFRAQHRTARREPGYTFALPRPWLRLDYIFAATTLARRLIACEVVTGGGAERASDHYPVLAEFV
jgi:endonuclease/exonuclease/phosphatase family metal-dependent hydrolase